MNNGIKNKPFEDRVSDFLRDLERGEGFVTVHREPGHLVKDLKVGVGKHAGLVYKKGAPSHVQMANQYYDRLMAHYRERGYEPYSYELVKPNFVATGERLGIVQDYYEEPSLAELRGYLLMGKEIKKGERKLQRELNDEEKETFRGRYVKDEDSGLRCEQFLKEPHNKDITLEQIMEVGREFYLDLDYLALPRKSDNVIVLGQGRGRNLERTGLAIIDY